MLDNYKYKFRIIHNKSFAWHIGIHFCIMPKDIFSKREVYLSLYLGRHDISIGYIGKTEE